LFYSSHRELFFLLRNDCKASDKEKDAFQESLAELMKGRTTFVIAHRLSTIRKADEILVIENGAIAERGNHDDLIASKGRYHDLYTYQARI